MNLWLNRTGVAWAATAVLMFAPATVNAQDAPPPAAAPIVLSGKDVQWASLPSGRDIARAYPAEAARQTISGLATITCRLSTEHTLEACRVLRETPEGLGFGDAAIALVPKCKLKPKQRDPRVVAGAEVSLDIGFRVWG